MSIRARILRVAAILAAAASLGAIAAPPLVVPHTDGVPKSARKAFKSEGFAVRFNLDELKSLNPGDEVEFALPGRKKHVIVFDRFEEVGDGIVNWIGHYKGKGDLNVIITKGPAGTFGRIATPDGDFVFSPSQNPGFDWLVDMVEEQPYLPVEKRKNDAVSPSVPPPPSSDIGTPTFRFLDAGTGSQAKGAKAISVVDLMVVYTPALRATLGSAAAVQTRIANMIATVNNSYTQSLVDLQLRLVHTVELPYVEGDEPFDGFNRISPNGNPGPSGGPFATVESLRNTHGADLVMLMMNGAAFSGSGVAWVPNSAVSSSWAPYMYSAMEGCTGFDCSYVFAHELGHNMGNQHDRATAMYDGNGTFPPGSFSFSYGHYYCSTGALNCDIFANTASCLALNQPANCSTADTANNFAEIMAYFHSSTTRAMRFSNPGINCAGSNGIGRACGLAEGDPRSADAARTINQNAVALSAIKTGTPLANSTTTLTSNVNPSTAGQSVSFTAAVSGSSGTPTGSVDFRDGGASISGCSARPLSAGSATCATTTLPLGTRPITAVYGGSATYNSSTSPTFNQTVNPALITPTVTVSSSANPSAFGASVNLTATLSSATAPGTVAFAANGAGIAACAAVAISSGTAVCTTSALPLGGNAIVATYSGGTGFTAATSPTFTQDVTASTSTAVSSSLNPSFNGAVVTFTGTVTSAGGTPNAGPMVFFVDGAVAPGCSSVAVSAGVAQCAVGGLSVGSHMVSAQFNGTTYFGASAASLTQTVLLVLPKRVDFNADRKADLLWQHTDGRTAQWLVDGPTQIGGRALIGAGTGWFVKLVGDFNGDGKADILWENVDGRSAMWLMDGSVQIGGTALLPAGTGYVAKLVADFNGDGRADIVWQATSGPNTGRSTIWLMNGTAQIGGAELVPAPTGWSPKFAADFDGNGKADILWEHTDGRALIWMMDGASRVGGGVLFPAGTGWTSKLVADFNGDGKTDIVWQHTDGRAAMWIMNGPVQGPGGAALRLAGTGYTPVLAGDIDGDGKADLVWQHANGTAEYWLMNGSAQTGGAALFAAGSGWTAKRLVDFSGDGRADVLASHTDGSVQMGIWNGTTFIMSPLIAAWTGGVGWSVTTVPE